MDKIIKLILSSNKKTSVYLAKLIFSRVFKHTNKRK